MSNSISHDILKTIFEYLEPDNEYRLISSNFIKGIQTANITKKKY